MFTTGKEIVAIPLYVLEKYGEVLGDKDFITILAFLGVQETGLKAWKRVAQIRGYASVGYLEARINELEKTGVVKRNGYELDFSPLFRLCQNGGPETAYQVNLLSGAVAPKENEIRAEHYTVMPRVRELVDSTNESAWARVSKFLMEEHGASADDIVNAVRYIDSLLEATQQHREFRDKVSVYRLRNWYGQWVEKGKPLRYEEDATVSLRDLL